MLAAFGGYCAQHPAKQTEFAALFVITHRCLHEISPGWTQPMKTCTERDGRRCACCKRTVAQCCSGELVGLERLVIKMVSIFGSDVPPIRQLSCFAIVCVFILSPNPNFSLRRSDRGWSMESVAAPELLTVETQEPRERW